MIKPYETKVLWIIQRPGGELLLYTTSELRREAIKKVLVYWASDGVTWNDLKSWVFLARKAAFEIKTML